MARSRTIKPSFFDNEYLAELPIFDRLLFIGLWTIADRNGRLEERPKRIKAALFPYDDNTDIDGALNRLCESSEMFITRYEVDEVKYLQINNFRKHQTPHQYEKAIFPPPHEHDTSTVQVQYKYNTNNEQTLNKSEIAVNMLHETINMKHEDINTKDINKNIESNFEALWKLYPKKKGKGSVSKTQKEKLFKIGYEHLKRCVERYEKDCEGVEDVFIKHGSTFFNSGYVDYLDNNYEQIGFESKDEDLSTMANKCAEYIAKKVLERTPNYPDYIGKKRVSAISISQKAIYEILENVPIDDFKNVFLFAQYSDFWQGKINSGLDLKKHYKKMLVQLSEVQNE